MKKPVNSNMYDAPVISLWNEFDHNLSGSTDALWCIISNQSLNDTARTALKRSATQLGYGENACAFLTLSPSAEESLSPDDLLSVIEGLDPLCLLITDAEATRHLAALYRQEIPLDTHGRIFGRESISFRAFETMLAENSSKQKAWALIKTLPPWKND